MNKDFLTRLSWACLSEDGTNLSKLCERTDKADKADRCFSDTLYATTLTEGEKDLLDNLSADVAVANEQQGFINGFRLGMKLARELDLDGEGHDG